MKNYIFLIKFYKNVKGGTGRGKPDPRRGRGWDVNIHPRRFRGRGRGGKWGVKGGGGVNKTRP